MAWISQSHISKVWKRSWMDRPIDRTPGTPGYDKKEKKKGTWKRGFSYSWKCVKIIITDGSSAAKCWDGNPMGKWYKRVFSGYVFQPITILNCCTTCISWEIGSYNTQQSRHTEHTHFCRNFVAKSATWFSENEGGGSKAVWNFSEN